MQHAAAVSNSLHPAVATTSSPAPRRASWPNARPSSSVRVRSSSSMRNGGGNGSASADSLDHLQRASMARQGSAPGPRPRRVIHTTPFGLWDSFPEARTLDQMVRTMERLMDGDGDGGRFGIVVPAAEAAAPTAVPRANSGRTPWEVRERAGEYLVRFDMPGMARDDVRVSVQDRTLVVVAEKKQQPAAGSGEKQGAAARGYEEGDEEEEAWPAASFGRYRTRVELPENVDVERIAAEVRDGVLYLIIPKLSAGGKVVNIQVH
ncbi:small heat shock protein, chloroplastic-like [Miscanthus floridulus]|uniref:small heat shock protein, chloroplastic-like n=1 Tax=Miscanthus floridulus TaxID=154761 RepID=UPI00345B011B